MQRLFVPCAVCVLYFAVETRAAVRFSVDPASPSIQGNVTADDVLAAGPVTAVGGTSLGLADQFAAGIHDNLNALSHGRDPLRAPIFFSVDRVAVGAAGSAVFQQAQPGVEEAAGDVFQANPNHATNGLSVDEQALGLAAGFFGDDLDALELDTASSWIYFSVDTLSANGEFSQDILISDVPGQFRVFARGVEEMGLQLGDDVDALALDDRFEPGILNPGVDRAWFSLSVFSLSVSSGPGPGDVLGTDFSGSFRVVYTAADLGLRADDELNALDTVVPEPASCAVWTVCGALAFGAGVLRRRPRTSGPSPE